MTGTVFGKIVVVDSLVCPSLTQLRRTLGDVRDGKGRYLRFPGPDLAMSTSSIHHTVQNDPEAAFELGPVVIVVGCLSHTSLRSLL